MRLADDRHHVVLAMRFHIDVAQHDHVVIALHVVECPGQVFTRILLVTLEPLLIRVDDASGGVDETFALRIVSGPGDQGAHSILRLVAGGALERLGVSLGLAFDHGVHGRPFRYWSGKPSWFQRPMRRIWHHDALKNIAPPGQIDRAGCA